MASLKTLIRDLDKLIRDKSPLVEKIKSSQELLHALQKLDDLIEMDPAKEMVATRTKSLILESISGKPNDHMSHVVIYGPPGVGKSKLGVCLAKIWDSLGLIKKPLKSRQTRKTKTDAELFNEIGGLLVNQNKSRGIILNEINSLIGDRDKTETEIIKDLEKIVDKQSNQIEQLRVRSAVHLGIIKAVRKDITAIDRARYRSQTYKYIDRSLGHLNNIITSLSQGETQPDPDDEIAFVEASRNDFVISSRPNFVDLYVGWTARKTRKFLQDNLGKVVFIDEAYSLITSERDSFGSEALTEIIRFMSEHPGEIVIIFAGYRDKLAETIFHPTYGNPGLERRCTWVFDIPGYTSSGLSRIFSYQLKDAGWSVEPGYNLDLFFKVNHDVFTAYGGDTDNLAFHAKLAYARIKFTHALNGHHNFDQVLTGAMIEEALDSVKKNKAIKKIDLPESAHLLYM